MQIMEGDAPPDKPGGQVGHKRPPARTRFVKGQSGNPAGRPKGKYRDAPYEAVLGQTVTVRDGAAERRMTAAEAFMLHMAKRGLEGDGAAGRALMTAIAEAKVKTEAATTVDRIVYHIVTPGSVNQALIARRMATKLDPYRPTARMLLEPWLVEAALARLGERRLTIDQQRMVLAATRVPHKVAWPDWWEQALRDRKS